MGAGWLDFKLGYRMLIKYPGLTFVGGLAIAVAIAIGAAAFEFTHDLVNPTLPIDEGERIVAIQNVNVATGNPEHRALHDFVAWREAVTTIEDIGAYATIERNLITEDGISEPAEIAEVTASAFRVTRTPALLGRPLVAGDEQPGAPLVAVIGYGVWQTRFGADSDVVGRTIQLGATPATVVGVMPQGFGFPVSHRIWMPLRQATGDKRLAGPPLRIFGRLAPGVSLEQAQAEVSAIGTRTAADSPETHAQLRPRVVPYVRSFYGAELVWQTYLLQSIFVMLVVVACANVATLIYARTATREGEIVLRTALGASRRRIVAQLFVEALVLASASAVVGLTAASWALSYAMDVFWSVQGEARPFWWNDELSSVTVMYVVALTVGGAAVAGVLPALNATRRHVQTGLQDLAAGSTRLRFGGVWTVVIVTQVALSVAFLPTAISEGWQAMQDRAASARIPVEELLSVRLEFDRGENAAERYREIARRVAAEAGVVSVSFADRLPGTEHPRRRIAVEDGTAATTTYDVRAAAVDVQFFETVGAPILAGRSFRSDDLELNRQVVLVNQTFVRRVLFDRNPIGRRIRYTDDAGASHSAEIVGVVADLDMNPDPQGDQSGMYVPVAAERAAPLRMVIHVAGDAAALAPRVRTISAAVDPSIRVYDLMPVGEIGRNDQLGTRIVASVLMLVASIALLLSTVGIYALMSFTVSQRTREIGIRVALGADARHVIGAVFSRALFQLGIGVAAGASIAMLVAVAGEGDQIVREGPGLLLAVSGLMMLVGLFSCVVPAARGLRIQPTEALRQRW